MLGTDDAAVLERVADGVFDQRVDAAHAASFLSNPDYLIVVALDGDIVVGMCTAVRYLNPDKPPALWINEIGVAPTHQRRGIGRHLLARMLDAGRAAGCLEAWLGAAEGNAPAIALYEAAGGTRADEDLVEYAWDLRGPG